MAGGIHQPEESDNRRNTMALHSILTLLNNEHGIDQHVREIPSHRAAALLLDKLLAEYAATVVDGRYIELPVLRVMDECEDAGIEVRTMQFVLNVIRTDAYAFGGRRGKLLMDSSETISAMVRAARQEEDCSDVEPVHRFELKALQQVPATA